MMHRQFADVLQSATAFVLNMVDQVGRATGLDRMEWDLPVPAEAVDRDREPEESGPRPVFWSQTELAEPVQDSSSDPGPLSLELVRSADRAANQNIAPTPSLLNTLGRPITQGEVSLYEFAQEESPLASESAPLLDFDEAPASSRRPDDVALLDFDDVYPLEENDIALLEFLDDETETTVSLRPKNEWLGEANRPGLVDMSSELFDDDPFELTKTYAAAAMTRPSFDD